MSKSNTHPAPQTRKPVNNQQNVGSQVKKVPQGEQISQKSDSTNVVQMQEDEEKIYQVLSTCYDDYLKGNKVLMNKIVNEMSNRHKEKEHIRMWLRASTKKLIDLFKNKQDVNFLIEIILYQMPWFEAGNEYEIQLQEQEQKKILQQQQQTHANQQQQHGIGSSTSLFSNASSSKRNIQQQHGQQLTIKKPSPHFELFSELSKFIMTLLSFSNAFAPQIIKFLISNIVPMEVKEMEKNKKSEIELEVEGVIFENQKKLLMYIRDIMNKYVLNSISDVKELNKEDTKFLLGVLKYHPNSKEKMERYVKLIIGQAQFDDKISKCLYIQNKEGQKIDISYVKSVFNLVDEQFQKIGLKQGSPNQKKMMLQVVDLLAKIIKIYPLYQNDLCRILQESYPHRVQGEQFHKIYLTNILQLTIKCPQLMPKILIIAIQKLIEIDSEIKLDYDAQENEKNSQIMAEKLDWLMLIIFEFIDYQLKDKVGSDSCFGQKEEIKQNSLDKKDKAQIEDKFFKIFLNVFSEQILITHQSKYVQFIIFYLCSLRNSFQNAFLNHLVKNITEKNPLIYKSTQINSIYYLGSYIARAKYIENESIRKIFEYLINHLNKYIQKFDERQKEENYNEGLHKIHLNLYHLLQAMLYILCYRFKAVLESKENLLQKFHDIMDKACSNFNALFFISPNIQSVFSDVCLSYGEIQLVELFQKTSQTSQATESISAALQQRAQLLDNYFPFDPYCLQYSDKFICEIYQNWQDNNSQSSQSFAEQQIEKQQSQTSNNKKSKKMSKGNPNVISNQNINNPPITQNSPHFNNSLNNSFICSQSHNNPNNITGNLLNTSRNNYGFTIDKLNNINDLEYDRDNMIDDDEDVKANKNNHILDFINESDPELQIQQAKYNKEKKSLNGKRRNPSTTDNSVNNTPITNNDEDSNNQPIVDPKKISKKSKKSSDIEDDFNNASFGHKKLCIQEMQF
ncbi:hypothetical protein ABPG74_001197 [Tetrahymena malaccensis]